MRKKFWCWWLHRYLYLMNVEKKGNETRYVFCDICDVEFIFDESKFSKLKQV